jgi:outer membrane lipoprotein-sorting protein
LRSTRTLAQRISATGRGEARVTLTRDDVMGGGPVVLHGTLALEPPDRVRIDFSDTGERIVVRGDGGEWLQPHLRQMIRLRAEQAGVASWLWDLFLHGGRGRFSERDAGRGRYVLGLRGGEDALPETLMVTVDAAGMPASLDVRDPTLGRSIYRFTGWKFTRARGRTAFVIQPPRGYTVIEDTDGF